MVEFAFIALFLLVPAGLVLLSDRAEWAGRIGPIVLCYAVGLAVGLSGLLPAESDELRSTVTEASLGLALPLLLFSVDIRAWGRVAGRAMLSMFLAMSAVVAIATTLYYTFSARGVSDAEQLSGMAVGMYTGGIANLGAIKLALSIPDDRYLVFATLDTAVGALYLLFVLTLAPRLLARLLPAYPENARAENGPSEPTGHATQPPMLIEGFAALITALVCVGLAVLAAPHVTLLQPQIGVIVILTTLGLMASLVPQIRSNVQAPRMGMYLIYVFTFCVAASMDLTAMADIDMTILLFVVFATFGSLALHAVLGRLLRIDRDTFLITSVAALMSPAFVPMVARALGNPAVLMSGMITGIFGFAIGNYLGISVALMLAPGG